MQIIKKISFYVTDGEIPSLQIENREICIVLRKSEKHYIFEGQFSQICFLFPLIKNSPGAPAGYFGGTHVVLADRDDSIELELGHKTPQQLNQYFTFGPSPGYYKDLYQLIRYKVQIISSNIFHANESEIHRETIRVVENMLQVMNDIVYDKEKFDVFAAHTGMHEEFLGYKGIESARNSLDEVGVSRRGDSETYTQPSQLPGSIDLCFDGVDVNLKIRGKNQNSIAVIGRNGAGKSRLLKAVFKNINSQLNKSDLTNRFSRLIFISLAPDATTPRKTRNENVSILKYSDISKRSNNYNSLDFKFDLMLARNYKISKELEELLKSDQSFSDISFDLSFQDYFFPERIKGLSTGHRAILSIILEIGSKISPFSCIIIDEPENYIHPPLLSTLVNTLNSLAINNDSVVLYATHSPIVLQEIRRENVYKLMRNRHYLEIAHPQLQTLGASFDELYQDIFNYEYQNVGIFKEIKDKVYDGQSVQDILNEYDGNLGREAINVLNDSFFFKGNK